MTFNSQLRQKTTRAQLLVNLATGHDKSQEEDSLFSDVFMSNCYDPVFEELQNMQYQEVFVSSVSQIECINTSTIEPIELGIGTISSLNPKERFILNEVTGHLKKVTDETINDEDYYLDENTGVLLLKSNSGYTNEENNVSSETEVLSSDEEQTTKQRDLNRIKRIRGQKYTGRKKKWNETEGMAKYESVSKPRKYLKGKSCSHSCISKSDRSFLCGLISEQKRKAIFTYFWSLTSWDAKKAYLKNLVRLRPILRRRKTTGHIEDESQRQLAYDYYMPDEHNNTLKICKNFLTSTLNINSDTLSEWIKKLQDNTEGVKDLRSKHEKRVLKDITLNQPSQKFRKSETVIEWLNLINKVPSHYCRSSSNRVYIEDTFESKSHIFRVYTSWCNDNGKSNIGRKLFNEILEKEKISIFKPRKDQCDICTANKEGNMSEEDYIIHIEKKNEAYKAHTDAIAMSSSDVLVITVDVQSILLCPKILVSVQYYKQKLQVHNQSIYVNNNKDVHLYVWHEGDGGVTANEFTSCMIDFLKSQVSYKKIIIISDGCSYQNRNKVLSSALLKLNKSTGLEIEQIILEKGHTMMKVDSVHSTLEKKFRPPIYSPSDYISRMREARPKQPYHVHHVDYNFFKNYEENICLDSIRPGKKAGDPTVNDIRALLYKDGEVFYKLRHPDDWQNLPQRVRSYDPGSTPDLLYNEPRKIDKTKYDSLQSLKPFMHRDYHAFYDNLQYKD